MNVNLDPVHEMHDGLSILVLYRPEGSDSSDTRIILKLADHSLIKHVLTDAVKGKRQNLTKEEQEERDTQKNLWTLNKVTLKIAGRIRGKVKFSECMAFMKAVKWLSHNDVVARKLFDGPAGYDSQIIDFKDVFTFSVKNPDFHIFDPGRYISKARPGSLVPYDISHVDTPEGDQAINDYVTGNLRPWKDTIF